MLRAGTYALLRETTVRLHLLAGLLGGVTEDGCGAVEVVQGPAHLERAGDGGGSAQERPLRAPVRAAGVCILPCADRLRCDRMIDARCPPCLAWLQHT